MLELWYLTDVDVSSYTGHYDMQIAYLFGFVFVQANASPGPLLIVASRLLSFLRRSFKSYFESSLLLCLMSSVLSPFIVVLNALAFGCILNFRLTFYTLMRYRS